VIGALRRLALRIVHACRPGRGETELARELAAHRALIEEAQLRRGLSPEDARLAAARALGGIEQAKELHRQARSFVWMDDARRDAWQVLRSLNRHRAFAAVAILTLAIGIGANTALFSAFNAVVLRPLPYRDPASLVVIAPSPVVLTSTPTLEAWRARVTAIREFAGFNGPRASTILDNTVPSGIDAADVTWNFLSFLGAVPAVGRDFVPGDAAPGAPRVVILSDEAWARRFGRDRSVIGRTLTIDGQPHTVIGITAPDFRFPVTGVMPATGIAESPQPGVLRAAAPATPVNALGRMAPGATTPAASAQLLGVMREVALGSFTQALRDRAQVRVTPLHEALAGPLRTWLLLVMATVAIVLLVACANVANLLLARASARHREFAVRAAVGARFGRLVRLTVTESLVLSLLAAVLALVMTRWAGAAARPLLADRMPHVRDIGVDWAVFAFNVGVATATGLLCSLASIPTLRRLDLSRAFNDGGVPSTSARTGMRRLLLSAEVGFTFVLVIGAVLLAQTFRNLETKDRGFDARGVLTLRLTPQLPHIESARDFPAAAAALTRYSDELIGRLTTIPGVTAAGMVTTAPLTPYGAGFGGISVDGQPAPRDALAWVSFVTPAYFGTLRMSIDEGRAFAGTDTADSDPVVIVNDTFRRRFAPSGRIIERTLTSDRRSMRVVGVVHDVVARTLRDEVEPMIFFPLAQMGRTAFFNSQLTVAIRTSGEPATALPAIRRAIWSADPNAIIAGVAPLEDRVAESLRAERQSAVVFTALAAIALLIAAIGVYGVGTYTVAQRTKELGLRIALGADRRDIVRLVAWQTLMPTVAGLSAGTLVAIGATRLLGSLLYGVTALDARSFATAAAVLTVAALLATVAPVRRVLRLDPLHALKVE
jgi:predicted permease